MKILYASTWIPPFTGGMERVAWEITTRVSKKHDVEIITTGEYGTTEVDKLTVHRVPYYPGLTILYSVFKKRIRHLLSHYDVVHVHNPLPWGLLLREFGEKMVVTCHGFDVYPLKPYPYRFLIDDVFRNCDHVTAASTWLQGILKQYNQESTLIRNGIDFSIYKQLKVKRKPNVVLFAGRYIEKKGIRQLVRAAELLPEYEFWFAGSGPLKSLINLKNTKDLGFNDQKSLIKLYNTATIGVFPSLYENNPMVALESMSCGLPIICTRTGFDELIKDNGMVLETTDNLHIPIKNLMRDKAKQELYRKKSLNEVKRYSWDNIIKQYLKLYEQ